MPLTAFHAVTRSNLASTKQTKLTQKFLTKKHRTPTLPSTQCVQCATIKSGQFY